MRSARCRSRRASLAEPLLRLFVAKIVSLQTAPLRFTTTPGERPLASPLARAQAAQGESFLASLRHKPVQMEDATRPRFVALMDGARTRSEIADAMPSSRAWPYRMLLRARQKRSPSWLNWD